MNMTAPIHVGVSGIYHEHWKSLLDTDEILPLLAREMSSAEIRYTFYHLPPEQLVKSWLAQVPQNFIFCPKAPKTITHFKKLRDTEDEMRQFLNSLRLLKNNLGPVVFELPKALEKDLTLLRDFLDSCPDGYRYVIEFRHKSWFDDQVLACLESRKTGLCITHAPRLVSPAEATTDFVYFKFYGTSRWFNYDYSREEIVKWSEVLRLFAAKGKEVFAFFHNDEQAYSYHNAIQMLEILQHL